MTFGAGLGILVCRHNCAADDTAICGNEDSVCGIIYNNTPYYFIKNLQGDIIAIVDKDAQTIARYSYDAWGVPEIKSDSSDCQIATINPFRYRGYYYDEEIGLYYLQSSYKEISYEFIYL